MRNMRVVDLGSGSNPNPQAGVIVDLYEEPIHRGHTAKKLVIPEDVKFVKADISNLPFKDKEFDFSFCKQVLEHVDDPIKCCKEIMRVSKEGYIECPTQIWETLFGRKYHKWLVKKEGNKIIFTLKNDKNCPPNTFRADRFHTNYPEFTKAFNENVDLFYVRFHWKDNFEMEII